MQYIFSFKFQTDLEIRTRLDNFIFLFLITCSLSHLPTFTAVFMMATKTNSRTRSASSSSSPPAKRQKITVAPFAASLPRRTLLTSSLWVNKVPEDIWVYKILHPFLDLKHVLLPLHQERIFIYLITSTHSFIQVVYFFYIYFVYFF